MTVKMHSILTVVNAHADVERSIRERTHVDVELQLQTNFNEVEPIQASDRLADLCRHRNATSDQASTTVSWGILFGSEYIWAPDVGPILIVCLNKAIDAFKVNSVDSSYPALVNCCILQFENKLSTRSSLRIFHSN